VSDSHNPIRLLFITAESWPTHRADVAVLFGKYLPRCGVESDLVAVQEVEAGEPSPWAGGGRSFLRKIDGGLAKRRLVSFWHNISVIVKVDAGIYHAIQVRDLPIIAALAMVVAKLKGIKFLYWMSFPMPEEQIQRAKDQRLSMGVMKFLFPLVQGMVGYFLLYRVVLPFADHIFVQSDRMLEDVTQHGIKPFKMTPVYMGIDLESSNPESIKPPDDPRLEGNRVLVYLGIMAPLRQIDILLEALALVREKIGNVLLILAGDTDTAHYRNILINRAHELGIENSILWTGWLPTEEAWRYVRASELGLSIFPRGKLLDSASPTKVVEYLALGIPVVANDNPDQAFLLSEAGMGITVSLSAENFASAILKLLLGSGDNDTVTPNRRREYISRLRSYDVISSDLSKKYYSLLK
jgi:glycosyltransferase involved in cell wall biosynthesis